MNKKSDNLEKKQKPHNYNDNEVKKKKVTLTLVVSWDTAVIP